MPFEQYKQFNAVQKEQFGRICNKLLSHCFLNKSMENDRSDFYFVERYHKLFDDYFKMSFWELDLDTDLGVAHLINTQNRNRYSFKLMESIILLAIRLIYHEKRQELKLTEETIMTIDELQSKLGTMGIQDRPIDKSSIANAIRIFRQFHLIELIDKDLGNSQTRIKLYPSLVKAVKVDDIRQIHEKIESYKISGGETDEVSDEDEID